VFGEPVIAILTAVVLSKFRTTESNAFYLLALRIAHRAIGAIRPVLPHQIDFDLAQLRR
jgi:hypothetical protein